MDFRPDAAGEVVRPVARELFGRLVTEEVRDRVRTTGTLHDPAMHAELSNAGWLTAAWPPEDGGQGRTAMEMEPFYEEAIYAEAPIVGALTTMLVAETLRRIGTPLQRETILTPIVEGRCLVCLGLSEPETGSDVAAARTRAVRDGDSWVSLAERSGGLIKAATLAVMNSADPTAAPRVGTRIKIVVTG